MEPRTTTKTEEESPETTKAGKSRRGPAKTAYERMVDLLSRRDHSTHELTQKLRKAEHSPEEIEAALEFARVRKWLPDESVIAARESTRLARAGKSPAQISTWLRRKGLPTSGFEVDPDEAVSEDESAYKTAMKSWARLVRTAERDVEKSKKSGKARRGWSNDPDGVDAAAASLQESLKNRVVRLLISRGFSGSTARKVFTRLLAENPL